MQQAEQVAGLPFRLARKAAKIAKQNGDFGFAGGEHDFRVFGC